MTEAHLINPDMEAAKEEALLGGSCEGSTGAVVGVQKAATLRLFADTNMEVHFFLGMNQDRQMKY